MTVHRRAAEAALALGLLLVLATASSVFAKEGIALLDTAPPSDPGGTSVDIGWVVTLPGPDGPERFTGANAFIRVRGGSGDRALGWAEEKPAGSGHYVANVTVPDGGITAVEIGLAEPGCRTKACANEGWMLQLSDDLSGFPVAAASAAPAAVPPTKSVAPPVSQPQPAWQPSAFVPIGLALASLLVAGIVVLSRSRGMRRGHAHQG